MEKEKWIVQHINEYYGEKKFNEMYQTLAILGSEAKLAVVRSDTAIDIMIFLSDLQGFFEDIKNDFQKLD